MSNGKSTAVMNMELAVMKLQSAVAYTKRLAIFREYGPQESIPFYVFPLKNKFCRLVIYAWTLLATTCVYYGWQDFSQLIFRAGHYEHLCVVMPVDPVKGYCMLQYTAVQSLYIIGISSELMGALPAGILLYYMGPMLTALVGELLFIGGWLLLRAASETYMSYDYAMMLMGGSVNFIALPCVFLGDLFNQGKSFTFAVIIAAQAGASGIAPIFRLFLEKYETSTFNTLIWYYVVVLVIPTMIIYVISLPLTQRTVLRANFVPEKPSELIDFAKLATDKRFTVYAGLSPGSKMATGVGSTSVDKFGTVNKMDTSSQFGSGLSTINKMDTSNKFGSQLDSTNKFTSKLEPVIDTEDDNSFFVKVKEDVATHKTTPTPSIDEATKKPSDSATVTAQVPEATRPIGVVAQQILRLSTASPTTSDVIKEGDDATIVASDVIKEGDDATIVASDVIKEGDDATIVSSDDTKKVDGTAPVVTDVIKEDDKTTIVVSDDIKATSSDIPTIESIQKKDRFSSVQFNFADLPIIKNEIDDVDLFPTIRWGAFFKEMFCLNFMLFAFCHGFQMAFLNYHPTQVLEYESLAVSRLQGYLLPTQAILGILIGLLAKKIKVPSLWFLCNGMMVLMYLAATFSSSLYHAATVAFILASSYMYTIKYVFCTEIFSSDNADMLTSFISVICGVVVLLALPMAKYGVFKFMSIGAMSIGVFLNTVILYVNKRWKLIVADKLEEEKAEPTEKKKGSVKFTSFHTPSKR